MKSLSDAQWYLVLNTSIIEGMRGLLMTHKQRSWKHTKGSDVPSSNSLNLLYSFWYCLGELSHKEVAKLLSQWHIHATAKRSFLDNVWVIIVKISFGRSTNRLEVGFVHAGQTLHIGLVFFWVAIGALVASKWEVVQRKKSEILQSTLPWTRTHGSYSEWIQCK